MLFTSCLYSSRVPKVGSCFLFLPKHAGICQFWGSSEVRAVTQSWSLDGQHRGPEVVSPARCGPVASLHGRGGECKGALATQADICRTCATRSTGRCASWRGSRLAKRARRAIPDPQHCLARRQRDLLGPVGVVLGSLRVDE